MAKKQSKRIDIGDATLYLGDCLDILPKLKDVDAVVTDPPYGVDYAEWDKVAPKKWLTIARKLAPTVFVTTGIKNAFDWEKPDWIACYSFPGGQRAVGGGFNAWEPVLIYGRNTLPLDHKQFPFAAGKQNGHPCPKPLAPFEWLVRTGTTWGGTVLDPFMGSGTTGVACAKLDRKFIGIELDPKYFKIACDRIREAYAQPALFPVIHAAGKQKPKRLI